MLPASAGRLFTLNWPARRLLARILKTELPAQPIQYMRIFAPDRRLLRFDAAAAHIASLAATVPEDDLLKALTDALTAAGIVPEVDAQIATARLDDDCWHIDCGRNETIAARLLVAADGAASPTAAAAGLMRESAGDVQHIETGWLQAPNASTDTAWQWFTAVGILALLPAGDGRLNFIFSRPGQNPGQTDLESLIDEECRPEIGDWRMLTEARQFLASPGRIRTARPRLATVGECAQSIYPLSGQSLAVGLGDVETLLDCLAGREDPGHLPSLQRYRRLRAIRSEATVRITGFFGRACQTSSPAGCLLSLAARIDSTKAAAFFAHLANAR